MIKHLAPLIRRIVGRVIEYMLTNVFIAIGTMMLPIGIFLLTISLVSDKAPPSLYFIGWVAGGIGIIGLIMAFLRSIREDGENRTMRKNADANFRSAMKTMEAIKGQLESIGSKLDKKR